MSIEEIQEKEKNDLFLHFLNKKDIILSWEVNNVKITYPDKSKDIDRDLYFSFKTDLCLAIAKRKKRFLLSPYLISSQDDSLVWTSILRAIRSLEKVMGVRILVKSKEEIEIRHPFSIPFLCH